MEDGLEMSAGKGIIFTFDGGCFLNDLDLGKLPYSVHGRPDSSKHH